MTTLCCKSQVKESEEETQTANKRVKRTSRGGSRVTPGTWHLAQAFPNQNFENLSRIWINNEDYQDWGHPPPPLTQNRRWGYLVWGTFALRRLSKKTRTSRGSHKDTPRQPSCREESVLRNSHNTKYLLSVLMWTRCEQVTKMDSNSLELEIV